MTPNYLGPTWDKDPSWTGPRDPNGYILPKLTLGWQIAIWVRQNLLNDEGEPFIFTDEQLRFVLWWYAIDENGRWLHRKGILQRLKGWG